MDQGYWYIIPTRLIESKETQKLAILFGAISSFTKKDGYCFATNKTLAQKIGRKDPSIISEYLTQLEKLGYIEIEGRESFKRKIRVQWEPYPKNRMNLREKPNEPSG